MDTVFDDDMQDAQIARILGFSTRAPVTARADVHLRLEEQVALRRMEVADNTDTVAPASMKTINVADVMHGVTVGWLATAFSMDPTTVKKKLRDCPPIFRRKAGFVYDLKQAAAYLVPPVFDAEQYMKTMKASELPTHLQESYWSAMRKRQQWEETARHLWRDDQVMEVLGDVFKTIKFAIQLWPDQVERAAGLSAEQRVMLTNMGDALQNEIHSKLIEMPVRKQTPSTLVEGAQVSAGKTYAENDDDDITDLV